MRCGALMVAALCALSVAAAEQGRATAPQPPAVDTAAPNIPGVVVGGTKVQVLKEGLDGTEGPIALPDGSVIFSEINANRLIRIDNSGTSAIDNGGRIYVATSSGVQVFTSQGQPLGTIPTPRSPQNLAFAGPGKKTLYIVGRGVVSKVQMIAEGFKDRAK